MYTTLSCAILLGLNIFNLYSFSKCKLIGIQEDWGVQGELWTALLRFSWRTTLIGQIVGQRCTGEPEHFRRTRRLQSSRGTRPAPHLGL